MKKWHNNYELIDKAISLVTLLVLYYIVGQKSIFLYVLSLSLYNIFNASLKHISLTESLKNIKSTSNKANLFKYTVLTVTIISFFYLLLSILISDIVGIILNITDYLLTFMLMGLTIISEPIIKLTVEYLEDITNNKKLKIIPLIWMILSNVLLIIIAIFGYRILRINSNISTAILYLAKILSTIIILILLHLINKDKLPSLTNQKEKINYKKEIKLIFKNNSYEKSIINVIKKSYYYISLIVVYLILSTRYSYKINIIENSLSFIYFYALSIIDYLICMAKELNKELPKEMSITSKIYNNFKIMLTMAIIFGIISPLTCKVLFYNPLYSIYLSMVNFMAIFILLYDITFDNIKNKKVITISLLCGLISKIVLIIPLINAFFRMGYNLIYGDIISSIIGFSFSIIINYIYLRNTYKSDEKYFEKILEILYENIILAIILILAEFIIPIDTTNYFKSLGLIIIYLSISIMYIKIKNKKKE